MVLTSVCSRHFVRYVISVQGCTETYLKVSLKTNVYATTYSVHLCSEVHCCWNTVKSGSELYYSQLANSWLWNITWSFILNWYSQPCTLRNKIVVMLPYRGRALCWSKQEGDYFTGNSEISALLCLKYKDNYNTSECDLLCSNEMET